MFWLKFVVFHYRHLNCNRQYVIVSSSWKKNCFVDNLQWPGILTACCILSFIAFTADEYWGTAASTQEDHHECVCERWNSAEKSRECLETWHEEGGPCRRSWYDKNTGRAKYTHRYTSKRYKRYTKEELSIIYCLSSDIRARLVFIINESWNPLHWRA